MQVFFSKNAKEFLLDLKAFIATDNPNRAKTYTTHLVKRIESLLQHPYIGKINQTKNDENNL